MKDSKIISQLTKLNQKLNPTFEEYVTRVCHDYQLILSKEMKEMLRKCYEINVVCGMPFTFLDFGIKPNTFQQRMSRYKPFFECVERSSLGFYKLRGIEMYNYVMKNPRGVQANPIHQDFENLLKQAQKQPLSMHDLRIQTRVCGLYENLVNNDHKPHPKNQTITLNLYCGERFAVKVNVYKTGTLQVMIGCSRQPITYDLWGFSELIAVLGSVCKQLEMFSGDYFYSEPIPKWKIVYYHINRDLEISGSKFSYCIHDLQHHSVIYNKKFGNGVEKLRTETHETPMSTIEEEVTKF